MKLIFPGRKINGVAAYARALSSDRKTRYLVIKQKTADGGVNYRCSCPGFMFRNEACRHIKTFKEAFAAITHR